MDRAVDDGRVAPTRGWFHRALGVLGLAAAVIAPAAAFPTTPPLAPLIAATPHDAAPALCEVRDGDTIIYLFGTFHTLDERTLWFDRSVRAAFDRSGELVLETITPTNPAEIRAIGRSIAGPRPAPFLAATRSAVQQGRADGLSVDHGADAVLRRTAADQGMTLSGIERFADQLRLAGIEPLPVTWAHALAVHSLLALHKDPFDRLLVAQAMSEPMHLLTHDAALAAYSNLVIVV